MTKRSLRQLTDNGLPTFGFVPTNCRGDPVNIEIVRPADSSPDLVEVVDDRVTAFHAELPEGNSSGVQMMGGFNPSERQTTSMVPRMVAFARCLQFQSRCRRGQSWVPYFGLDPNDFSSLLRLVRPTSGISRSANGSSALSAACHFSPLVDDVWQRLENELSVAAEP